LIFAENCLVIPRLYETLVCLAQQLHDLKPHSAKKPHIQLSPKRQQLVINHALIDGNKRLGWLATAVFLEINNFSVAHVPNDDVYELVMHVASNNPPLSDIVQRLRAMTGEMP
jgi:hypothetical protein